MRSRASSPPARARPIAGYWAKRGDRPLDVALIPEGEAPKGLTFTFAIAAGVRRGDASLRDEVDAILLRRRDAIDKLLARYDVPRR